MQPHEIKMSFKDDVKSWTFVCSCKSGSGKCKHIGAILFHLMRYEKKKKFIDRPHFNTSKPEYKKKPSNHWCTNILISFFFFETFNTQLMRLTLFFNTILSPSHFKILFFFHIVKMLSIKEKKNSKIKKLKKATYYLHRIINRSTTKQRTNIYVKTHFSEF